MSCPSGDSAPPKPQPLTTIQSILEDILHQVEALTKRVDRLEVKLAGELAVLEIPVSIDKRVAELEKRLFALDRVFEIFRESKQ